MNLFKKVIATIAMTTIVVSTTAVSSVSAYDDAATSAAAKLAAQGVIVDHSDNVAKYQLANLVKRQEVAAMAFSIAKLQKATTCKNEYSDVSATKPNTWACYVVEPLRDNGFLAKNAKFHPEANITKAEALGMMVSAAFGDAYKYDATKGTSWQEQLVKFAVDNNILDAAFTDYNTPATRGTVFKWTVNAIDAAVSDVDLGIGDILNIGNDTTNTGTTTNANTNTGTTTNTPATTNTVKGLAVSTSPLSLTDGSQIPNVGIVRFAKVDFTAGNEDVNVNTIKISKLTLASIKTDTRVWFEKDGKRISGKAAFSSDNTAIITFSPAFTVKAGETETLDLYVELPSTTPYAAGNDLQFKGQVTDASVTVDGDGTFVTPLLTTASYTVASAKFTPKGVDSNYNDLSNPLELGKFDIENTYTGSETRDETFQTITLRQTGNADLANLSNLTLVRNGEVVSKDVVVDGKYVTFTVNDTIKDGTTAIYYVKAIVNNVDLTSGDTYQFQLKKDTDLNVIESATGFRSTVDTVTPANLALYTVTGSDITFNRDPSTELSKNVAIGTDNVVLVKGTISNTQAITIEDPVIKYTSSTGANVLFNNVYLKIGSSVMTWTPTSTSTGTTGAKFSGLVTVPAGTTTIEIYANIRDNFDSAETFKFDDIKLSNLGDVEYANNQNTVTSSVGSIPAINVTIDETNLSVNRVDGLGNTTIAQGSKDVLLNTLALKVTQGNNVVVSNASYTVNYSGAAKDNVFLTLYANDAAIQTKTVNVTSGDQISFDNLNETISDTPVNLTVKADFSDAFTGGTFSVKLNSLEATDILTSKDVAVNNVPNSAVFTIAQAVGTLSSSDNNPHKKLLLAGTTNEKLLAFRVRATNDNIKLRDLVFTGANLDKLNNFKITDVNGDVIADSATTANSTEVTFKNLNVSDVITKDSTKTYYIAADVNLNTSATGVVINLNKTGSTIKSSNGTVIAMVGNSVSGNEDRIEENMAVVAKDSNNSKDLATSAIRFSITATGNNQAILKNITINPSISGYTGTTDIAIYKDSVSDSNLVGTGTYTNNSGDLIPTTKLNTIDAGSTNHYIVAFRGSVVDSNANSSDWSVNITNASINLGSATDVNVSTYDNMGTLPLTETK